ncbi:MAG: hypothetical protein ACQEWW_11765 [Bacillota bacterium]
MEPDKTKYKGAEVEADYGIEDEGAFCLCWRIRSGRGVGRWSRTRQSTKALKLKRITALRMKAHFAFTGEAVLAEELGDGTEQYEVSNACLAQELAIKLHIHT